MLFQTFELQCMSISINLPNNGKKLDTFRLNSLRTVFLMAFLVQINVGLHVPYELMSEELGLLRGPQDVLAHVAHLSKMAGKMLITAQG